MPHTPPAATRALLGPVASLPDHPDTMTFHDRFRGASFLCRLPGGALYFESGLELDTDGSAFARADPTGQAVTSATDVADRPLDADAMCYIVLPGGGFAARHNLRLGDIAAVFHNGRMAFACVGDIGPPDKLGEGSIALHRALGYERVVGGRLQNVGIAGGVVTIVFPNTGRPPPDPAHPGRRVGVAAFEAIQRGTIPFLNLQGFGTQFERWVRDQFRTRRVGLPRDRAELERALRSWVDELVAAVPRPPGITARALADHLLATADGLDVLLHAPTPMGLPAGKDRYAPTPVYARFDLGTDTDNRPFVKRITFHLDPATQAAAERELAAGP